MASIKAFRHPDDIIVTIGHNTHYKPHNKKKLYAGRLVPLKVVYLHCCDTADTMVLATHRFITSWFGRNTHVTHSGSIVCMESIIFMYILADFTSSSNTSDLRGSEVKRMISHRYIFTDVTFAAHAPLEKYRVWEDLFCKIVEYMQSIPLLRNHVVRTLLQCIDKITRNWGM